MASLSSSVAVLPPDLSDLDRLAEFEVDALYFDTQDDCGTYLKLSLFGSKTVADCLKL